jgi:DNA replication ATP-dependent helicase Dna2
VWSPPGTGKTARLAKVVRTLVDGGERVLVLAYANAAVDMALLRGADAFLESAKLSGGKVLRLGVPQLPEVRLRRETLPETIIERTKL